MVSSTVTFGYCQFPIYFIYAIRGRYAPNQEPDWQSVPWQIV